MQTSSDVHDTEEVRFLRQLIRRGMWILVLPEWTWLICDLVGVTARRCARRMQRNTARPTTSPAEHRARETVPSWDLYLPQGRTSGQDR